MGLQVPEVTNEAAETSGRPRLGIGMDASVTPIPDMAGTSLAQTTDFFYPLVDDPYLQVSIFVNNSVILPLSCPPGPDCLR